MRFGLKLAIAFALIGYAVAVGIALAPLSWNLSAGTVFVLMPVSIFTATVDPSFTAVLVFLAPLNAVLYGAIGLAFGILLNDFLQKAVHSAR